MIYCLFWLSLTALQPPSKGAAVPMPKIDEAQAARFAELALACVHREYPNKIAHVMNGDGDALPPRQLHPVFYGCFDWHSSVHGHWLLVRLLRQFPEAAFAPRIEAALDRSLTAEAIAGEVAYFKAKGRTAYERPYGLAWLLQLSTELFEWNDPRAKRWHAHLRPLEEIVAHRFRSWLPKLSHPIRTGEHSQTAFAFGLALDWARATGDSRLAALLYEKSQAFYLEDRDAPLAYEPSGQDFLSPVLAEADLMRRVLDAKAYAGWLTRFMPKLAQRSGADWLPVAVVTDASDGKLAHLDGLNLSRAWMLEGIAAGLPPKDSRREPLLAAARSHRTAGLASVTGEHYEGGHWLASFAVYLVTTRGY
ncbi:DUF2891 domain-containing protein [Sulfidibacter corallicola]|uniref:DUF2891 domain-containing protein n=1 Tax=Sulfidibacter corallicola TaxID=2818388 RepID=A0A8A4TT65_SULCO|nr:DUF2891 domain-containing protein [Sulfidibacter corallicola]QTD52242.1 DUF2891 domain-containing protein [Sulfidibacter corallicola]